MTHRSDNPAAVDEAELAEVPVFPLPGMVLFPGTRLPLHIFEPRYREMMADCRSQGRELMVMAQLARERQPQYLGDPPMHPVAGLGRIEWQRKNDNGTYDLQLLGLARVRLSELPMDGRLYRRARAELLTEQVPEGGLRDGDSSVLYNHALQTAALVRQQEPRFRLLASPSDPPALMIDKIADQFISDPSSRQELLGMTRIDGRFRTVAASLARLRLELMTEGERTLH